MTRFFFHIRNGFGFVRDEEGQDMPGREEATEAALTGARSLISDEAMRGTIDLRGRIEVTNEADDLLFTIEFRDAVKIVGHEPDEAAEHKERK